MKKQLVILLLVAVMAGILPGVGQAAVYYADSVTGVGVGNPSAMLGKSDGDFTTLTSGGSIYLTFGGSFLDKPTGADFALYFSKAQNLEPMVYVATRNSDGTWVNLDPIYGASNIRTYEIAGTGTGYYDTIRLTWDNSGDNLNGFTQGVVVEGGYAPVPEPGTMMLLGSGLVGIAAYGRKKFRK